MMRYNDKYKMIFICWFWWLHLLLVDYQKNVTSYPENVQNDSENFRNHREIFAELHECLRVAVI